MVGKEISEDNFFDKDFLLEIGFIEHPMAKIPVFRNLDWKVGSGMNVFDTPTLEYFHVNFTDKWGDGIDLPFYSIGFEFMVAEKTSIPQPETIFRARQKLMDIS